MTIRKWKIVLVTLLVTGLLIPSAIWQDGLSVSAQSQSIQVLVNEKPVAMPVPPVIRNGVTLVPFRSLFEALGFKVSYHTDNQTITGESANIRLTLQIGSKTALVNGVQHPLLASPVLEGGNTLVPLRFVAESTGRNVMKVGNTIYIRNRSYQYSLSNRYDSDTPNFTAGNEAADYIGEDDSGNIYFYWKVRSKHQDQLYVSILNTKREWIVRQQQIATIDHWENTHQFEWVKGNVYLTRDKVGLRYFELSPDGTVSQDRYLDKQAVTDLANVSEVVAPVYSSEGGRGILYQKKDQVVIYLFDKLDQPIVIPKKLERAQLWVLDASNKLLFNVNDREINAYDLKGNPVYDQDGQRMKSMIDVPKDGTIKHIGYRDGKLYFVVQTPSHHLDILSAEVFTERKPTFVKVTLKQNYEYFMTYFIANNSTSWADIVSDQLHIYCNLFYGDSTATQIGVMEMNPIQ